MNKYILDITFSDELYHHGILGQKWGIRRFQNPDGSLTSAGKKRYDSFIKREDRAKKKEIRITKKIAKVKKKSLKLDKKNRNFDDPYYDEKHDYLAKKEIRLIKKMARIKAKELKYSKKARSFVDSYNTMTIESDEDWYYEIWINSF